MGILVVRDGVTVPVLYARIGDPTWSMSLTRANDGAILSAGMGMSVIRVSKGGSIEATYPPLDPGPSSTGWNQTADAYDVVPGRNGTTVLGGRISSDELWMGIGRRLKDGSPDPDFGTGGARAYGVVGGGGTILILRDGRYVLAGSESSGYGLMLRVWD